MDLESRQSVEAGTYLQLGTFSIFTFFQQEVSLFCKKNKKAKERLKTNVKSRMDSELSKRFSANEETIYYDHYSSFAPRTIFLGGEREDREGCFIFLLLVGSKNVEYKIILSTG